MIKKFTLIVILSSLTLSLFAQKTKVVAWGDNSYGQCNIPNGLTSVVGIAAGGNHSLALKSDSTVVAWGYNSNGQTTIPNGLASVVGIVAGTYHSMALKSDGTVVAWGENSFGQSTIPVNLASVVGIAAGYSHSMALKSDGTVVAWGNNDYGQCNIPNGLSSVVGIAAGYYHSMVLKSDGTIVVWGYNSNGQTTIPVDLSSVVGIAAGAYHSMALKMDGTVVAWGENSFGQSTIPVGLSSVVGIAAGETHSIALQFDGKVVAWGYNNRGQTIIPIDLGKVIKIAQGSTASHTMVIVELKEQTITGFNTISTLAGFSFTFPTTATSGLTVDYSFKTSANNFASSYNISGNTFSYTDLTNAIGASNNVVTVTIKAMQTGNNTYAATEIEHTFVVSKITQTITGFNALPNTLAGFSFTFPSTATSGLSVDYSFKTSVDNFSNSYNISGNTFSYTDLTNAIGASNNVVTVTIKAMQNGNNTYAAATEIQQTFVVSKILQTITGFNALPNTLAGFSLKFPSTATSGLAVAYSFKSTNSFSPNTEFSFSGNIFTYSDFIANQTNNDNVVTVTMKAMQIGDNIFKAANEVEQTFTITKYTQTITGLNIPQTITFGSTPIQLPDFATSGLPNSYVANGTGAIISNNILYFIGKGVATITSSQIGNNTYSAAETIVNVVSITGFQESVNAVNTINGALLSSLAGLNAQITSLLGIINQVSTVNSSFQTQLDALLATNAQLTSLVGLGSNPINTLSLNPNQMQVQYFSSNYIVNIQTNCTWVINSTDEWLSVSPISGTGNSFINITTDNNILATNRVAIITVSGCSTLLSTFTLTQKTNPVLSIEEAQTVKTKIYPNPISNGVFTIENGKIGAIIEIYNSQGNLVYTQKIISTITTINTNLPIGIYTLKMGATFIEKLIVE